MGGLLGGQSKDQTTTSQFEYPQWVKEASRNIYGAAETAAERPYPLYDSARIAPKNPDQEASFDLARRNVGNWQPYAGMAAASGVNAVTPVGSEDISRYMNPYQQQVIDSTREQLYRQQGIQDIARKQASARSGGYLNEDRQFVAQNLSNESTNRLDTQMTAALKSQAFTDALDQARWQKGMSQTGAGQFLQQAGAAQNLGQGDVGALNVIGGEQQNQEQANLDLAYADFLRQFGYSQEQITYLLNTLRGTPVGNQTDTTGPVAGANPFGSALGGAATGAAISGGNPWGAAIGGGLGFLSAQ